MLLWIVRGNVQNEVFKFSNRGRWDVGKKISEKETQDEPPNMREEIQGTLKVILDRLKTEIRNEFTRLSDLDEQLEFLLETESLIDCCIWWQFWRRRARLRNCRLFIIPKALIELLKLDIVRWWRLPQSASCITHTVICCCVCGVLWAFFQQTEFDQEWPS